MKSGGLRHRVTLQAPVSTEKDGAGQPIKTWETVGVFWANVRTLDGSEGWRAKQLVATATDAVTMRHLGAVPVTTRHRLLFRGRTLGIASVVDDGNRRITYELLCEEIRE